LPEVIVVYESQYGNTKRVAETIVEGIREVGGIETKLTNVSDADLDTIPNYDAILIGSPNHASGPTRSVKKFVDKLGKLPLQGKGFAVFDTYTGKNFEIALKKMEQRIRDRVPALQMIVPGLSIQVQGMKGPIVDTELPRCKGFGTDVANKLLASS
jgi:flavorubredoxin